MKKKILLGGALFISLITQAQFQDALLYHKDGQLEKAKAAIDKVDEGDRARDKSKFWTSKGNIYLDLAQKQTDNVAKYSYYKTAAESYATAIEKDAGDTWVQNAKDKQQELAPVVFNDGVVMHQANDLDNALKFYELALTVPIKNKEVKKKAYINSSMAAAGLDQTDKAIDFNKKILEIDPNDSDTYQELILLHEKKGETDTALKYAEEAVGKFPEDVRFTNEVARLAVASGNTDEAIAKLKMAIEKEPKNTLYTNKLAEMYSDMDKPEEAEKYFKKTLAIDPDNLDANYNLGSLYFNLAAGYIEEMNDLDLNADPKKSASLRKKAMENFEKCLPYYEKVYPQLSEGDKQSLRPSMEAAYIRLGRDEEIEKLK